MLAPRDPGLAGAWRLVSFEIRNSDGTVTYPWGRDVYGYIMYGAGGHMSVIFGTKDRPEWGSPDFTEGTRDEVYSSAKSLMCYAGTYEIDQGQVTHHLDICIFPNWERGKQVRFFTIDGSRLTLSTPPMPLFGKTQAVCLVWERVNSSTR